MQWAWGVRGSQVLLRLRVGRGETEQGLCATCRLTAAQEFPGLEDWCAGGPSRLLQSEKRSQMVILCVFTAPHLQA